MVWIRKDLRGHTVLSLLPWAGSPSTWTGHSEPYAMGTWRSSCCAAHSAHSLLGVLCVPSPKPVQCQAACMLYVPWFVCPTSLAGLLSTWEIPDEQPDQQPRRSWNRSLSWETGDLTRTHQCRLQALRAKKLVCCFTTFVLHWDIWKIKASIHRVSTYFFSPGMLPVCCRCPLSLNRISLGIRTQAVSENSTQTLFLPYFISGVLLCFSGV